MTENVFQIFKRPIHEDYFMIDEDLNNHPIADYFREPIIDLEKITEEFYSSIPTQTHNLIEVQHDKITFLKGFKEEYFEQRYIDLKNNINLLSFDSFTKNSFVLEDIQKLIDNKTGPYVYQESETLNTLDYFVRELQDEETYYIGNMIPYHY